MQVSPHRCLGRWSGGFWLDSALEFLFAQGRCFPKLRRPALGQPESSGWSVLKYEGTASLPESGQLWRALQVPHLTLGLAEASVQAAVASAPLPSPAPPSLSHVKRPSPVVFWDPLSQLYYAS